MYTNNNNTEKTVQTFSRAEHCVQVSAIFLVHLLHVHHQLREMTRFGPELQNVDKFNLSYALTKVFQIC